MALRLNDLVLSGELFNTRKNSVHGYLRLRDFERPLVFELTGNCDADLAGRHVRFAVRDQAEPDEEPPPHAARAEAEQGDVEPADAGAAESEEERQGLLHLTGLAWVQIGPTGTMTAARRVRVSDCSPRELYVRSKLDEPPPTRWTRCLYLEWFSQNGRVGKELDTTE